MPLIKKHKFLLDRKSIAIILLLFGYSWIIITETIIHKATDDLLIFSKLQLFKGLFFVSFAVVGMYALLYIRDKQIDDNKQFTDSILETTDVSLAVIDRDGNFERVNRAFEETFGYQRNEIEGQPFSMIIPEQYRAYAEQQFNRLIEGSSTASSDWNTMTKNGDHIQMIINASPMESLSHGKRMIISMTDISRQQEIREKLNQSLKEKEVLLSEVHHRVKNNLAVISGLSQLQAFQEENEEIQKVLLTNVNRIQTIASVHEMLYQSKSLSSVEFDDLLHTLAGEIQQLIKTNSNREVDIKFNLDPAYININQAIPCALIINEILTTAFNRPITDKAGRAIGISMQKENSTITLRVNDHRGGPKELELENQTSLSQQMVDSLTRQLEGNFNQKSSPAGITSILSFKQADIKGSASTHLQ